MADATAYLIEWIGNAPASLRNEAIYRAREALEYQPDAESWLRDLKGLISYHWNFRPWQQVSDHTRKLRETLTHEQIEAADWAAIARALTA